MYGGYLQRGKIFLLLKRVLLILFISFFLPRIGFSQNMPVPENIQAALIPKVLKFSPNHAQKTKLRMVIVYDNNSQVSQKELKKAIGTSLDVKSVVEADLEQNIGNCDLVYFMPGTQKSAILCKTRNVLSVTGISNYVEQGIISIAFGLQDNKPKIFVNLTSLAKEGQSLSSEILRITKVYN